MLSRLFRNVTVMSHGGGVGGVKLTLCQKLPMKIIMKTLFWTSAVRKALAGFLLVSLSLTIVSAQTRTIRVATYNIEDDIDGAISPLPGLIAPPTNTTAYAAGGDLEGIGEETVGGDGAQPLDILALQETTSNPLTVAPIVNALNTFYNCPGMYTNSTYQAIESDGDTADGNGPNAIVYNTRTLQLLASQPVDPASGSGTLGSSSGEYREVVRYEFAPAGVASAGSNEFYIYVSHYKSGTTSTDIKDRAEEAAIIRTNEAIDLPATARVLYVGDYNVDNSAESEYQTILSNGIPGYAQQGGGVDPYNPTNSLSINWSSGTSNTNILLMLSEHSYELEYRDDLQLMTTNVYGGAPGGLAYVPGTYHTFGNNGTVAYEGTVTATANTALNNRLITNGPVFLNAAAIYTDLTDSSDHLPVVADYTLPLPAPVITGVSVGGPNLSFSVADGITGAVYTVLTAPTLGLAPSNWVPVTTNISPGGNFSFTLTNAVNTSMPQQFYLLQTQ